MEQTLRAFGAPIVSRHIFADYRLMGSIVPDTGIVTALVARLLGCAPIYICGIECYSGSGTYHHDPKAHSHGSTIPLELHLKRWREALAKYPGDYRALGGPLAVHIPTWCVTSPGPAPRERLLQDTAGRFVTTSQKIVIRGRALPSGTYELPDGEAARLVRERKAVYA